MQLRFKSDLTGKLRTIHWIKIKMIQLAWNKQTSQIVRMCYGMCPYLGNFTVMSSESLEKEMYEVINFKALGNWTQIFIDSLNSLQHGCHSFVIDTLSRVLQGHLFYTYIKVLCCKRQKRKICARSSPSTTVNCSYLQRKDIDSLFAPYKSRVVWC